MKSKVQLSRVEALVEIILNAFTGLFLLFVLIMDIIQVNKSPQLISKLSGLLLYSLVIIVLFNVALVLFYRSITLLKSYKSKFK